MPRPRPKTPSIGLRRLPLVGAGVGALVMMTGCGAVAEAALEGLAEETTGFEIDQDDGEVSVAGDDFELRFTSPDGAEGGEQPDSLFLADAPNPAQFRAEVPAGFPVPHPPGGTVEAGSAITGVGGRLMELTVRYQPADLDRLVAFYDEYFADDPTVARQDATSADGAVTGFYTNPGGRLTAVTVHSRPDGLLLFIETSVAD